MLSRIFARGSQLWLHIIQNLKIQMPELLLKSYDLIGLWCGPVISISLLLSLSPICDCATWLENFCVSAIFYAYSLNIINSYCPLSSLSVVFPKCIMFWETEPYHPAHAAGYQWALGDMCTHFSSVADRQFL